MKKITKSMLLKKWNDGYFLETKEFFISNDTFLDSDALEFLANNNISLKTNKNSFTVYIGPSNEQYYKKPEHMTSISGNNLVYKDHKRIILRGRLDSLHAHILQVQTELFEINKQSCLLDLDEILKIIEKIISCEVLEQPLKLTTILGMSLEEIHKRSHFSQKYYNIPLFYPNYKHGKTVILLNSLRVHIREIELFAYETYKQESKIPSRKDIILILNRLSSILHIMMLKEINNEYN